MDRSLNDGSMNCYLEDKSRLNTLEWLVDRGYFQNNRQMIVNSWWQSIRFFRFILSMNNLAKLSLLHWTLILTQAVPQLFRSCPKLTELHLRLLESQELEMNEDLKNELRTGFQKIRLCELICKIGSWQIMQEMFT